MPELAGPLHPVLSPAAARDIVEELVWTGEHFGESAAARYEALLTQAISDIAADPERPGSRSRRSLGSGVRTYHLFFSRQRARAPAIVHNPRHFLVYRRAGNVIHVLRLLHDARDLERHLPGEPPVEDE